MSFHSRPTSFLEPFDGRGGTRPYQILLARPNATFPRHVCRRPVNESGGAVLRGGEIRGEQEADQEMMGKGDKHGVRIAMAIQGFGQGGVQMANAV